MGWRDERGRLIFRYQDQAFGIGRMGGLAVGMAGLAAIAAADRATDTGIFELPFWAYALLVMVPVAVLAVVGGMRLERAFAVRDVRRASRFAKAGFIVLSALVCVASLLVILAAAN